MSKDSRYASNTETRCKRKSKTVSTDACKSVRKALRVAVKLLKHSSKFARSGKICGNISPVGPTAFLVL